MQQELNHINNCQAIIEFAPDGTILRANHAFLLLTGYLKEEIIGKSHAIFVDYKYVDGEEYLNFWHRLLRGESFTSEFKRYGKHGREIWMRATYNPIFDKNGQVRKIIQYAYDINDYQLKMSLLEAAALNKSQTIIEFSPDGLILNANQNFLDLSGYRLKELEGASSSIFTSKEHNNMAAYTTLWNNLKKGVHFIGEIKRIFNHNKIVWLHASANPIMDENNKIVKIKSFIYDISYKKQLEAELKSTINALKNREDDIETYIYITSHDLKKPLNHLFKNASSFKEDYGNILPEEVLKKIDRIEYLCKRMEQLTDDLLYFSRIGKLELSNKTKLLH